MTDVSTATGALIGGMAIEGFHREIREKRAFRFAAAFQNVPIYDLAALEDALQGDPAVAAKIDLYEEGRLIRLADVQRKSGKSFARVAAENFLRGCTVRVRDLDQFDGRLRDLAEGVARMFAADSQINLYLTPPGKRGFPPHFDTTDVFVVQVAGRKQWRIYEKYAHQVELPLPEIDWDPDRFRAEGEPERLVLEAGDVLYIPRGVMHAAQCEDRESLHLTISLAPLTIADLLSRAVRLAAEEDAFLRRRAPWELPDGELGELVKSAMKQVAERVNGEALRRAERPGPKEDGGGKGELLAAVRSLVDASVGRS